MEKNALHHSPSREYSHAWGEMRKAPQAVPENRLLDRSVTSEESPEAFPLEQLSAVESRDQKSRASHFFSLTRLIQKSESDSKSSVSETDTLDSPEKLESRLSQLQNQLSDYRWTAETEIIDRTSDAVVHLDQMANEYRASVRAELEKFRDEAGDQSLLRNSLVNSALQRISGPGKEVDQFHHSPPFEAPIQARSGQGETPIFFNHLQRPEKE